MGTRSCVTSQNSTTNTVTHGTAQHSTAQNSITQCASTYIHFIQTAWPDTVRCAHGMSRRRGTVHLQYVSTQYSAGIGMGDATPHVTLTPPSDRHAMPGARLGCSGASSNVPYLTHRAGPRGAMTGRSLSEGALCRFVTTDEVGRSGQV